MLPVGKDLISAFPALVTDSTLPYALQPEIRHNANGAALCILFIFRTLVSSLRYLQLFHIARKLSTPAWTDVEPIEDIFAPNILRTTQHHAI